MRVPERILPVLIFFSLFYQQAAAQDLKVLSTCDDYPAKGEVFMVVEDPPYFGTCEEFVKTKKSTYQCSDGNIQRFIRERISSESFENSSGEVVIQLIVEKNGCLSGIQILRGNQDEAGKKIREIVAEMPNWSPGTQRGRTVRVKMQIPFSFE